MTEILRRGTGYALMLAGMLTGISYAPSMPDTSGAALYGMIGGILICAGMIIDAGSGDDGR